MSSTRDRISTFRCATPANSDPAERDPDVSRHPTGKVDDLKSNPVSTRTQMVGPQLVDLLRQAGQRLLPPGLLLVDCSTVVGGQIVWEAIDERLSEPVIDGAGNDPLGELNLLLFRKAGRL